MWSLIAFALLASAPVGLGVALRARRPWLVAVAASVPTAVFAALTWVMVAYDLLAGVVGFGVLTLLLAAWGVRLTQLALRAKRRDDRRRAYLAACWAERGDHWFTHQHVGGVR